MANQIDLAALLPLLNTLPVYQSLTTAVNDAPRAAATTLPARAPRSVRMPLLAALAADVSRPLVLVTDRRDTALLLIDELLSWQPHRPVLDFAEPSPVFYERSPWGPRTRLARLQGLVALTQPHSRDAYPVIVASARALLSRTMPLRDFNTHTRPVRVGQTVRLNQLLSTWHASGYIAEPMVTGPGQYSRRGGLLDVWPPTLSQPVRIEFFGDEIDQIRMFDPATQRSTERLDSVLVCPAREAMPQYGPRAAAALAANPTLSNAALDDELSDLEHLGNSVAFPTLEYYLPWLHPNSTGLLDYAPPDTLVVADDWQVVERTLREQEAQALDLRNELIEAGRLSDDSPAPNLTIDDVRDQVAMLTLLDMTNRDVPDAFDISQHVTAGARFAGQLRHVLDHLLDLTTEDKRTVVISRQGARLADLWSEAIGERHVPFDKVSDIPAAGQVVMVLGTLANGFVLHLPNGPDLHVLTDSEIFGWSRIEPRRTRAAVLPARVPEDPFELTDFAAGDYVVHLEYGIGRYLGLVSRTIEGSEREYLHIEYAKKGELFVPIHHADRVTRFVGADDSPPTLSSLGTSEWVRSREKTRKAVELKAKELLELYATRATVEGFAYPEDDQWQREMEASFPYIETPDQQRAIDDVKHDMQRPQPMDRLLCGDVGYGKTEVALRAAFKAVTSGKQVAVLVPTTILAQQHFDTFRQRLAVFPINVEMLSRFRTKKQQDTIVEKVIDGEVDIVIGTHRLLSKDVAFKELGLVVVDEEQRFGVSHKERLKRLRTEIDVLTLTATPIPRTLYMSLTGVRDISTINTPPEERLPVVTHVGPWDERLARKAILRELDRGGQVFFVHNRVQTIRAIEKRLLDMLPGLRLGVGHGQMPEKELASVMRQFVNHEIDVLLSTTIIESGVDIPNANTLIVDRADMFGLAQLYQIRGRVGRGANRAYAYFFYLGPHSRGRLTRDARLRLETLAEQTELGAGYNIAMRDLEIRGAGELLGHRQSGHIQAVGFHLYTRLLRQAVKRLGVVSTSDEQAESGLEADLALSLTSVDLPLSLNIPVDYIGDRDLRLKLYRRLAGLHDADQLDALRQEFADRFGPLPASVENLLYQMQVKFRAQRAGVESVAYDKNNLILNSAVWDERDNRNRAAAYLDPLARTLKGKVLLTRGAGPTDWQPRLLAQLDELAHVVYPRQSQVVAADND